jgi:hypothetical protein
LRRLVFRVPFILEIKDGRYINENFHLIDSTGRIYVARVR